MSYQYSEYSAEQTSVSGGKKNQTGITKCQNGRMLHVQVCVQSIPQRIWNFTSKQCVARMMAEKKEMDTFLWFIDKDEIIQEFLIEDTSFLLADKYLLAMVFTYFKRARYTPQEFTSYNFFVALFLALDIEDDCNFKSKLYNWALGYHWKQEHQKFHKSRDILWKAMDYRGIVTRACCEKVISLRPHHPIWQRERRMLLAEALHPYKLIHCKHFRLKSAIK